MLKDTTKEKRVIPNLTHFRTPRKICYVLKFKRIQEFKKMKIENADQT